MSPTAAANSGVHAVRVALIGNPNTGKSTLFNALAGTRVRTGNFPGVTVEQKSSPTVWQGQAVELIDLPGTYSLSARSPDEMVTVDVLTGCDGQDRPDVIVCVCNAEALERNLFLVMQILEVGLPTVVCLNMWDSAEKSGLRIDLAALSSTLGVPVVTTSALKHQGLQSLQNAILQTAGNRLAGSAKQALAESCTETLPEPLLREVSQLQEFLRNSECPEDHCSRFLVIRSLLDANGSVEQFLVSAVGPQYRQQLQAARARLADLSLPVPEVESTARYALIGRILQKITVDSGRSQHVISDRLDAVLTHRIFGFLICLAVMFLVFSSIYWFSQPLSDGVDSLVSTLADVVRNSMSPGSFRSLLVDGVISGVGSVLVFLPQICLLFLFIALLEDCGYMARAAFMMDRVMAVAGLSGRSFLPLMSSFACAVPAIMATRVIEDRKDRLVTIMIAPLMSCSARLPVYVLMIGLFVPDTNLAAGWLPAPLSIPLRAVVLLGISSLGLVVALPVAILLRKTILRGEPSAFLLELPDYRIPSLSVTLFRVRESAMAFVKQAGTLILATSVLVWFAGSWPGNHTERYALMTEIEQLETSTAAGSDAAAASDSSSSRIETLSTRLNQLNSDILENSLLGRAGHLVEPLVRPLGWDWRIGVGVIASFPAREVIVATMGTIFRMGADVDEEHEGLRGALRAATRPDGSPLLNLPAAASIMVFFALCAQCVSTLVVIRNETHSWRWPIFSFVYMTTLAWLGAFITWQIGCRL